MRKESKRENARRKRENLERKKREPGEEQRESFGQNEEYNLNVQNF